MRARKPISSGFPLTLGPPQAMALVTRRQTLEHPTRQQELAAASLARVASPRAADRAPSVARAALPAMWDWGAERREADSTPGAEGRVPLRAGRSARRGRRALMV